MKESLVSEELEWLEARAAEIKMYVDQNPYHEVQDRTTTSYTKHGESYETVVQKIEVIHKSLRDSLKEYAQLIEAIDTLREKEVDKNLKARGGREMTRATKRLASS